MLDRGEIPDSHIQIFTDFERAHVVELFRVFRSLPDQDLRTNALKVAHIFLMNFMTAHTIVAGADKHPTEADMFPTLAVTPPTPLPYPFMMPFLEM